MKLSDLFEMPRYIPREMDDEDMEEMKPFFIADARLADKYDFIDKNDGTETYIAKNKQSAIIGLRERRHDGSSGIMLYGILHFKTTLNLAPSTRKAIRASDKILQVDLVTVVRNTKFMGLGSFLYSSLVQSGYAVISDNKQFAGGKELWKKIGRSHLSNEVVLLIDHGEVIRDAHDHPIMYDGSNIPDDDIWSEDRQKEYVLFLYVKN